MPAVLLLLLRTRRFFPSNHHQYSLLTTQYSLLTTQYSVLTTQYSLLTTHYSVLSTQYSLLSTHYSVLSILSTQYSLLSTQYSLLTTQYSVLSAQYSADPTLTFHIARLLVRVVARNGRSWQPAGWRGTCCVSTAVGSRSATPEIPQTQPG